MPGTEITIKNYRRSKKFGWGYSTTPTGEDAYSIEMPTTPDYEGTIRQLGAAKANDRTFNSLGGAFYNTAWFYKGQCITATWLYTRIYCADDLPYDPENDDYGLWQKQNDQYHWNNDKHGHAWTDGFHCPDGADVAIKTE